MKAINKYLTLSVCLFFLISCHRNQLPQETSFSSIDSTKPPQIIQDQNTQTEIQKVIQQSNLNPDYQLQSSDTELLISEGIILSDSNIKSWIK